MTTVPLPRKVTEKLKDVSLRGELTFVFASSSSGEGMIGESWLLMTQTQLVIVVQPLVEDLKITATFKFSELAQIGVRRTFLGDIRFTFMDAGHAPLAEFEVPSLQREEGEELIKLLAEKFPGKVCESREDVLDAVDISGDRMMTVRVDHMKSIADTTSGVQVDNLAIDSKMSLPGLHELEGPLGLGDGVEQTVIIDVPVSQTIEVDTDSLVADPLSHSHDRSRQEKSSKATPSAPSVNLKGSKKPRKSGQTVPPPPAPTSSDEEDASVDCTKCGRTNRMSFQYCLACGHQLPQATDTSRRRRAPTAVVGASTSETDSDDTGCGSCLGQLVGFIIFLFIFQAILSAVFK